MKVGAASKVINAKIGTHIQGATTNQIVKHVRDNLEANAIIIEHNEIKMMFVSCDLIGPTSKFVEDTRKRMADATDLEERNIIISSTHTHAGPSIQKGPGYPDKPVETEYLEDLADWLVELAKKANSNIKPSRIGWNSGNAKIGYNRRTCYAEGNHEMHGNIFQDNFTGMESAADDGHYTLCAVDKDDKPVAIVHCNTSHPTNFYGADFLSADYPGTSRKFLRDIFGPIPVLYLNGTIGDTGPQNRFCENKVLDREGRMLQQAHILTGETLRQIYTMSFHEDLAISHEYEDLEVLNRVPTPEEIAEAKEQLKRRSELSGFELLYASGIVELAEYVEKHTHDTVPVHAVKIGEFAIVTQPCELFTHFGLQIKRRSPFKATAICGLADGERYYCPTAEAIIGGGFSAKTIFNSHLSLEAGYLIVESASKLLRKL